MLDGKLFVDASRGACNASSMETATVEVAKPSANNRLGNPNLQKRAIDWQSIREAFVKRPERPTYEMLAEEFAINRGTIANAASDEGWPILRAQYVEGQLEKADAGQIIVKALSTDRALSQKGATFGMRALDSLLETLDHPKMKDYAPSTKSEITNTCTFAFVNVAKGLREMGITGISKTLDQAGKESNGQWNPQLLQQINVNVGEIITKAKGELASVIDAKPTEAKPADSVPTS